MPSGRCSRPWSGPAPAMRRWCTKADIWEGGHRVPFVARWPGVVEPGLETAATVVHTQDPTEAQDVAADNPEVVERLEATLERFRDTGRSAPLSGDATSTSGAIVRR